MSKRIFEVELAHRKYGENWSRVTVEGRSALEAIKRAVKKDGNPQLYAMEVKLIATLD